jgi:hypothetical protein
MKVVEVLKEMVTTKALSGDEIPKRMFTIRRCVCGYKLKNKKKKKKVLCPACNELVTWKGLKK